MQFGGDAMLNRKSRFALAPFILASCSFALAAEGSFDRTLQVRGPVNLQIETGSGSIHVRSGSSNEIHVTGLIRSSDWLGFAEDAIKRLEQNPPIQQSGNDIRIGHIDDPELRHKVSISYEVVTPANTQLHSSTGSGSQELSGIAGPVEANAGSGSLKISEIASGVRAHTGSGSIEINGAKAAVYARAGSGSIHAVNVAGGFDGETGSGRLSLEQSAPGAVHAETGSGGLELRNVHGSLQARAGSGNIKADGEASGEWVVHTGSGSVRLRLPQNASFDLDAHTGSGSINLNHPVTVQGTIGRKEVRGKVGNGGVPVQVETGSGNIVIE
jgi:Putative adhesin